MPHSTLPTVYLRRSWFEDAGGLDTHPISSYLSWVHKDPRQWLQLTPRILATPLSLPPGLFHDESWPLGRLPLSPLALLVPVTYLPGGSNLAADEGQSAPEEDVLLAGLYGLTACALVPSAISCSSMRRAVETGLFFLPLELTRLSDRFPAYLLSTPTLGRDMLYSSNNFGGLSYRSFFLLSSGSGLLHRLSLDALLRHSLDYWSEAQSADQPVDPHVHTLKLLSPPSECLLVDCPSAPDQLCCLLSEAGSGLTLLALRQTPLSAQHRPAGRVVWRFELPVGDGAAVTFAVPTLLPSEEPIVLLPDDLGNIHAVFLKDGSALPGSPAPNPFRNNSSVKRSLVAVDMAAELSASLQSRPDTPAEALNCRVDRLIQEFRERVTSSRRQVTGLDYAIIVDDISSLLDLRMTLRQIYQLVDSLRSEACDLLVLGCHLDEFNSEEGLLRLVHLLSRRSVCVIEIKPLVNGYTTSVDGELKISFTPRRVREVPQPCEITNVIYRIRCNSCEVNYIGETGKRLQTPVGEHMRAVRRMDPLSLVAEHCTDAGHTFAFQHAEILGRGNDRIARETIEAWHTRTTSINCCVALPAAPQALRAQLSRQMSRRAPRLNMNPDMSESMTDTHSATPQPGSDEGAALTTAGPSTNPADEKTYSRCGVNKIARLGRQLRSMKAIRDFPPPTSKRQLQRFLGMVNFYRRFLPNCADLMLPLTNLLSGPKGPLELRGHALTAFERIKTSLADATLLTHPAPEAPLSLMVDASTVAVGAVL
nr:unnamed protein product [Spirometra erinaceieuropaei]